MLATTVGGAFPHLRFSIGASHCIQQVDSMDSSEREKQARECGILEGDGSRDMPFRMPLTHPLVSTATQAKILNRFWGEGAYQATNTRNYSESSHGDPGNRDLCETIIKHDGVDVAVWFDLSNVTALMTKPEHKARRDALEEKLSSIGVGDEALDITRTQTALLQIGQAREKRLNTSSSQGCSSLFALAMIGIGVVSWLI